MSSAGFPKATKRKQDESKMPEPKKFKGSNQVKPDNQKKKKESKVDSLEGLTFVFTGIMQSMDRNSLQTLVQKYGARTTQAVSGKTSFLVYGETLEDGRDYKQGKKYQEALKKGIETMSEQQFDQFIQDNIGISIFSGFDGLKDLSNDTSKKESKPKVFNHSSSLWVDKYAPSKVEELIGNKAQIKNLYDWLANWGQKKSSSQKKEGNKGKGGWKSNPSNFKAVLISGPPGIGKTTAARMVAQLLNYQVLEKNASDNRSRKAILEPLKAISNNQSLNTKATGQQVQKMCIVMDEVDGLSAGDRGGSSALIEIIKNTQVPFICICNDRQSRKIKSLANHCYDMKFAKPTVQEVSKRVLEICEKENLALDKKIIQQLVTCQGSDVRQIITNLQTHAINNSKLGSLETSSVGMKDTSIMISNFEAAQKLMTYSQVENMSRQEKVNLFFVDYQLIPLLVQENYINSVNQKSSSKEDLLKISLASESIALGDTVDKKIRSGQQWSLLPQFGELSCIFPGQILKGQAGYCQFPQFLGRMQSGKKIMRLLKEVQQAFSKLSQTDLMQIKQQVSLFSFKLLDLVQKEEIELAAKFMFDYNITPEMIKEHLSDLNPFFQENWSKLQSSSKAKLTKIYNTSYKESVQKSKSKVKEKDAQDMIIEEMDGYISDESESQESQEQMKAQVEPVKVKKKPAQKKQAKKQPAKKGQAKKK